MAHPIIAISATLAPLLVALACLIAWRKLDGGRHLLFWAVGAYNRLVRLKNIIANAFGQIDVQLKRRHIPTPDYRRRHHQRSGCRQPGGGHARSGRPQ